MATENITVKLGLDTSQFDNSVKGMSNELKALQKIDISLLSKEDAAAVMARLGQLKNGIKDLKEDIARSDKGDLFQSLQLMTGPLLASISAMSVGMEMFGVKSETAMEIQRKMMGVVGLLGALQTIADADRLKALLVAIPLQAKDLSARLATLLTIKATTAATLANAGANEVVGASVVKLTWLQRMWNLAVAANPIMLIVAGVAALGAAIWGLSAAFSDNTKKIDENNRGMDGVLYRTKELRDISDEMYVQSDKNYIQLKKVTGEYDLRKAAIEEAKLEYEQFIVAQKKSAQASIEEVDALEGKVEFIKKMYDDKKNNEENIFTKGTDTGAIKEKIAWYHRWVAGLDEASLKILNIYEETDAKIEAKKTDLTEKLKIFTESTYKDLEKMAEDYRINAIKDEIEKENEIYKIKVEAFNRNYALQKDKNGEVISNDYNSKVLLVIEAMEKEHSNRLIEINNKKYDDLKKLHMDYYNNLLKNAGASQERMDELMYPRTEQQRIMEKYSKDFDALVEYYTKNKLTHEQFIASKNQLDIEYRNNMNIADLTTSRENYKKRLDLQKTYLKQTIEQQRNAELKSVTEQASNAGSSPKQIAELKLAVNKKYDDQIYEYRKSLNLVTANEEIQREIAKLDRQLLSNEEYERAKRDIAIKYQTDTQLQVKNLQSQMLQESISGMFSLMGEYQSARQQQEQDALNKRYEAVYKSVDDELKYKQITSEEADAKRAVIDAKKAKEEKALKIKQAKEQKQQAIMEVMVNLGVAIMKAYAEFGPAATAMIPWLAGIAGIQSAFIAARPLPQYKTGSMNPFNPQGDSGAAILHKGEMVLNSNAVDAIGAANIAAINKNPFGGSNSYQQMVEYVDLSFQKYNSIPVYVRENEITTTQNRVATIKENAEV